MQGGPRGTAARRLIGIGIGIGIGFILHRIQHKDFRDVHDEKKVNFDPLADINGQKAMTGEEEFHDTSACSPQWQR